MDARLPAASRCSTSSASRCRSGAATSNDIDFQNIYYYIKPMENQGRTWDDVPEDIKNTFDRLGIPEAERKFLAGVGAQYESEVVYHSLREDSRSRASSSWTWIAVCASIRTSSSEYFGTVIPPDDNKLAALNSAVWSGGSFVYVPGRRQGRDSAAGVLPHQRRERGPVRANADHRRRGQLRPLRRGLHGADLQQRLAAQRGGRDHRQARRARALHHDPELVEERLQPGDQAHQGVRRRHHGVGGRQPRQQADDEVSELLPDGAGRQGRDPVGGIRRRRPAPGCRRQDRPRRAAHHRHDLLEVDQQGSRAAPAIAAW